MRNKKGITLIALIITIIVLLILAGVVISTLDGNNGILQKGKEAASDWRDAEETEQGVLDGIYNEIENATKELPTIASKVNNNDTGEIKIGHYVNYTPTPVTLTNSSPIIQNLTTYSGNTSSAHNKIDSTNPITQETGLKWRVLDKTPSGEVRLISETPTTSKIMLNGAKGYNNAVKLSDDFCYELYSNPSLTSNVQNLKIEDIEKKLTPATLTTVHASPYGTYPYGAYSGISDEYPKIWEQEIGAIINGIAQNGTLGLSEQENYTTEGAVTTATSIQVKCTYWWKSFGISNSNQFEKDIYHELFIRKDGANYVGYWMSSRSVSTTSTGATFYVTNVSSGSVGSGFLYANDLYYSNGNSIWNSYAVRPVVTLNSNVKVIDGNGTAGWNIQ